MVARNDITGDAILTRVNNQNFEEQFDIIFNSEEKEKLSEQKKKEKEEYWARVRAETEARLSSTINQKE